MRLEIFRRESCAAILKYESADSTARRRRLVSAVGAIHRIGPKKHLVSIESLAASNEKLLRCDNRVRNHLATVRHLEGQRGIGAQQNDI